MPVRVKMGIKTARKNRPVPIHSESIYSNFVFVFCHQCVTPVLPVLLLLVAAGAMFVQQEYGMV